MISICSKIQQNWYFSLRFQNSIYLNNMRCSRSILDQCRVVPMRLHIGCLSGYSTGCSTCNSSNCTRFQNNLWLPWRFRALQAISIQILEEYFQQLQLSCRSRYLNVVVKSFSGLGRVPHTEDGSFLTPVCNEWKKFLRKILSMFDN